MKTRFVSYISLTTTVPARFHPRYLPYIPRAHLFECPIDGRHGYHERRLRAREVGASRRNLADGSTTENDGQVGGDYGSQVDQFWQEMEREVSVGRRQQLRQEAEQRNALANFQPRPRRDMDNYLGQQIPTAAEGANVEPEDDEVVEIPSEPGQQRQSQISDKALGRAARGGPSAGSSSLLQNVSYTI